MSWQLRWLTLTALLAAGCGGIPGGTRLETEYGSRQQLRGGSGSVNGLGVLAEMFESAGDVVSSARKLSPRVKQADVIIWPVNDGGPPSPAAIKWLEDWLQADVDRTLIIIPRDYDAAPLYWRKMQSQASARQLPDVQQELADAENEARLERALLPAGVSDWHWFEFDSTDRPRQVTTLAGDPAWTRGVNPADLEIELHGRLIAKNDYDRVVLSSGADNLVISREVGYSQVLIVTNGSFLLNVPLVNKEHRKLAGALINEVGGVGNKVVFLEASGDVEVTAEDEAGGMPSTWDFLNVPPLSYLLRSMALFSVVLIFAMWPIFGIPRDDAPTRLSDFGRHIEALGKLLARRGDSRFAWSRVMQYRKLTEQSGASAQRGPAKDELAMEIRSASGEIITAPLATDPPRGPDA